MNTRILKPGDPVRLFASIHQYWIVSACSAPNEKVYYVIGRGGKYKHEVCGEQDLRYGTI